MENASKALMMAGGVLLTMLVVSLVIYAWNVFSDYYTNQENLKNIDDVAEFNLQFVNYDRKDVSGYELVSLANKIADYNTRYSNVADNKNSIHANSISMTINLISSGYVSSPNSLKQKLTYNGDTLRLFKESTYTQSSVENDIEKAINIASQIEADLGDAQTASKVARSMDALLRNDFSSDEDIRNDEKKKRVELYNAILPSTSPYRVDLSVLEPEDAYTQMMTNITGSSGILAYYEYYQFKKGVFECTDVQYDDDVGNGKISSMTFVFTGKIE